MTQYRDVAYFDFDEQPDLKRFLYLDKDPERTLRKLSIVHGTPIKAGMENGTGIVMDDHHRYNIR